MLVFYCCCIGVGLPGVSQAVLWDEGFTIPRTRSDFGNFTSFPWSPCPYHASDSAGDDSGSAGLDAFCPKPLAQHGDCAVCTRTGYQASNMYSMNYSGQSNFWVLSHNIDAPAPPDYRVMSAVFWNDCVTGPPGQSWQVIPAGPNVFTVSYGETGRNGNLEWRLGLHTGHLPACLQNGIPYLSIGDDIRSGHRAGSIGYWRSAKDRKRTGVSADYRIFSYNGHGCDDQSDQTRCGPALYYLLGVSQWAGKPRGLFIYLGRRHAKGVDAGGQYLRWNFPNSRSFWQKLPSTRAAIGGADWAYLSLEDPVLEGCIRGCDRSDPLRGCMPLDGILYSIQVDFACAFQAASRLFDTPMPGDGAVKHLYGVHWAIEAAHGSPAFPVSISVGVSNMTTY